MTSCLRRIGWAAAFTSCVLPFAVSRAATAAPTREELEVQSSGPVRVDRSFAGPAFARTPGVREADRRYHYSRPDGYASLCVIRVDPYAPYGFFGDAPCPPARPRYGPHGYGRFVGPVPLRWFAR